MAEVSTTDAIHHRIIPTDQFLMNYKCYDCDKVFQTLEDVASHSLEDSFHGTESCLKCRTSVLVFIQMAENVVIRIHKCKKSSLRHLESDLKSHSRFLLSKSVEDSVIWCGFSGCPVHFDVSDDGIDRILKHVNKSKHTTLSNCRKCCLPEFRLRIDKMTNISHFCVKSGRNILISV